MTYRFISRSDVHTSNVCFLASHVVHKHFLSNVVYWSGWIKQERLGLFLSKEEIQMSVDGEERGEGMQERTDPPHPHDVNTLVNALTEDDLQIFYLFSLWLSWISLSCYGESQYEEGRTVTGEWISREHLITSVCVESCAFWMRTQCLSDWGSHSRAEVHRTVMCGVFKRTWMFCHVLKKKKKNLVSCLSSRDGVKMVD